jgi:hypothetical protein
MVRRSLEGLSCAVGCSGGWVGLAGGVVVGTRRSGDLGDAVQHPKRRVECLK